MARSRNVKHPGYYGFGGAHYIKHPTPSDVFYVTDAARGGSDTNNGLTPDTPFLTITYALTRLSGAREAYIFVQRTTLASETWPIEITQAYLHLIGTPDQASPTPAIRPQDNNHGLVLAAGGIEVAGLLFSCPVANQDACIYSAAGQQWMNHIHHNYFAWDSEAYDCIRLDNQQQQVSIHHNYFGAHGFSNYAIVATDGGGAGRTLIEDNLILVNGREMNGAGGIYAAPLAGGGVIRNNDFSVPGLAAGEAIWLTGGQDWLVTSNVAAEGSGATASTNPYREDGANHWGLNYSNQTAQLPA